MRIVRLCASHSVLKEISCAIQHFDLLPVRPGDRGCSKTGDQPGDQVKKANQVIEVAARQNRMSLPHLVLALAVVFIELINNPILAAQDIHTFHPQVMFIVIATGNKVNTVNTVSMGNMVNTVNMGNTGNIGIFT